ncbi:hypothetical protein JCM10207_008090 [Rhodosporidiobolus poonsookiae]
MLRVLRNVLPVARTRTPVLPPSIHRYSSSPLAHPHPSPSTPSPPPALQRPQKHGKSKKTKSPIKPPRPLAGENGPLLPVGLRAPAALAKGRRDPPDGTVIALTTAESYDTAQLLNNLQHLGLLEGAVNLVGEAILLPRWSPSFSSSSASPSSSTSAPTDAEQQVGEVYIFESGTLVMWGLSRGAAETFLRRVIRGGEGGFVEEGRYAEPETEVLEFWVGKGPTRMSGDSIHLSTAPASVAPPAPENGAPAPPSKDLLERLAFSAGMARVTKLGVYEEQFDAFAEGVAGIPKLLQSGSEAPVKKTDIIKRVGTLHSFRQKLNLEDENLLDEPEFLWEDAALHRHYESVCEALEFESRLTTLNDRVDYAFSLQTTLMELLNAQTSHRLEVIIILLIAFEIALVILREGLPFLSSNEEEDEGHGKKKGKKVEA